MAITVRDHYHRSAASDRGADAQSITTASGDVVLALWLHPYGNNVYFNWDDSVFPVTGGGNGYQAGLVVPATIGAHHIDAYCDNGGPNLLMVWMVQGAIGTSIRDVHYSSQDPGWPQEITVTPDTIKEGMVFLCCQGDSWNCGGVDAWFSASETEDYYDGNYNGWYPSLGGHKDAASAATTTSCTATGTYSTGDPSYWGVFAATLDPAAIRSTIGASLSHKGIAIPSGFRRTTSGY